jgi:hypothetical protein
MQDALQYHLSMLSRTCSAIRNSCHQCSVRPLCISNLQQLLPASSWSASPVCHCRSSLARETAGGFGATAQIRCIKHVPNLSVDNVVCLCIHRNQNVALLPSMLPLLHGSSSSSSSKAPPPCCYSHRSQVVLLPWAGRAQHVPCPPQEGMQSKR